MQHNNYHATLLEDDSLILTSLENQLRRLSHYQAMPLPAWLAD